jgi:predicted ATP-dependent protease
MVARKLAAADIGMPHHQTAPAEGGVFALSSHARAKEALDFGLSTNAPGFNIFVVGADRSGRMTETLAYLQREMASRPLPPDWLYLNNFRRPHRPRPVSVPGGSGRRFRDAVAALIPAVRAALQRAFEDEAHQAALQAPSRRLQEEVARRIAEVQKEAEAAGLAIVQTQGGPAVAPAQQADAEDGKAKSLSADEMAKLQSDAQAIATKLAEVTRWATGQHQELALHAQAVSQQIADEAIQPLVGKLMDEFADQAGLRRWLEEMRVDILDNIQRFATQRPDGAPPLEPPERRYAVNLYVDHGDNTGPQVVLEPNPTYENLFGRFEYRQEGMRLETDFSMLRAGALHRANGGVLVLRADALAAQPMSWIFLKGALRDREIQMEDLRQQVGLPIAGAPRPKPIPLNLKVVLVGAPQWFYTYFAADPDFQTHFRIKADIDSDMPATPANLSVFAGMMQTLAKRYGAADLDAGAISEILAQASRLAGDATRITSRFELLEDVVAEAHVASQSSGVLTAECIERAIAQRRIRNARIEDQMHERIADGTILIETSGAVVGQVNGLTVSDTGDHAFGAPSRVTARASAGREGVINIERHVAMGGPIQQKGALILQGFLSGMFAQSIPMSFTCSITFEQNYGGVEGDSASLAETVAVISALSGLPARQDIAITGSMNQHGQAQIVGGVLHKVEGFYRACLDRPAGLTGAQGVIVPATNAKTIVVGDDLRQAVADGRFSLWTVEHIDEALELLLGRPVGKAGADGVYPPDSIFGLVSARLTTFNEAIASTFRAVR